MAELSARQLIVNLVTSRPSKTFSISHLCQAAATVGVEESNVRMTATRLAKEGVLRRVGRGEYALEPGSLPAFEEARHWRDRLDGLQWWDGTWIAVESSRVAREDKPAAKRLERGLVAQGFAAWRPGFFLRPNNVRDGFTALRDRLPTGAATFLVTDLATEELDVIRTSWNLQERHDDYRRLASELTASLDRRADQPDREFARESMLLGSRAIRLVVRDPLFPDELDDKSALRDLVPVLDTYQEAAQDGWAQLLWNESWVL